MPMPLKSGTSPTSAPDLEILGDQVTVHPSSYVEPLQRKEAMPEHNLVEHMAHFRESPLEFLREVSLHVSGTGWRAYDDYIGQPIFYSGFSENMKTAVMSTPMLKAKIQELAEKRVQVEQDEGTLGEGPGRVLRRGKRKEEIVKSLEDVAGDLTDGMICKMESKNFIRGAFYSCTQLLTRAYHQGQRVRRPCIL